MSIISSARLEQLRTALKNDPTVAALYLFGSCARGNASSISDIDIGILLYPSVDAQRYFDLKLEFLSRIMSAIGTEKVDVVILNRAPLHLAYEVVAHGNLLLDREPRQRAAFEADCIGRFLDFKPFLAVQARAVKEHLLKGTYFD
jgi:predicted nucleotidyltransferase